MVLATRCPHCETVFRVQEAMLAGSGGFARCGHCHQVFDARSNLLDPHAGTHDFAPAHTPETPAAQPKGEPARDEDREPAPAENPERRESETPPEAPFEHPALEDTAPMFEPPLSAEVPPLAAPVFAPRTEPIPGEPDRELDARLEGAPAFDEREPEPQAEPSPADEERAATPSVEPEAPPTQSQSQAAEPLEPAGDERTEAAAPQRWMQHDPHWHDDEPRLGGLAPSEADAEPRFAPPPNTPVPTSSQAEHRTPVEPEFVPRRPPSDFVAEQTEDEPHLEPHLRARLQAHAEEEQAPAEPRFGAAADEAQMRTAGAPPVFPEPPVSGEHERHFAVTRETRARAPSHVFGYVIGAVIALALIVVLIAQLAWWRREAVMIYWPDSQPLFARVCAQLGCRLSPPRDIDGLQVEASDLRQVDGPHRLELRVPLRNRYGIALAYPAIELTLTDNKNDIAIRRVLWPQDYVPPGTPIAAGLPAHATQTMIVRLDSGNAVATNFRVQIFYP